MNWRLVYTKQAQKDAKKLASSGLKKKAESIIKILRENPYQVPPAYEKLVGDLAGAYSRRINIQHRMIYQILNDEKVVKIFRMWTHYDRHSPSFREGSVNKKKELERIMELAKTKKSPPAVLIKSPQYDLFSQFVTNDGCN